MTNFHCIAVLLLAMALPAHGTNINVVGLFPNKALVQIDGGPPRTLALNQKTPEGITLLAVDRDGATFEVDGRRRTLKLGQAQTVSGSGGRSTVTLAANSQGHFLSAGQINGAAVEFVVDTGATLVSLSAKDARRIGINHLDGKPVLMRTANGTTRAYQVKLDTVRVGDITLNSVDAVVLENQDMPVLLGMSFLNRTDMRREGQKMVITRRY